MSQPKNKGVLFICATPIGHLGDCTFRLIETLKSVHLIAAEDTRQTKKLLMRYDIQNRCISLQKFNESERLNPILQVLEKGEDVAIVSDAGTPNICDPGAYIVSEVLKKGFQVSPIPGPSAITALLSVSGILSNQFIMGGFFPKKSALAAPLLNMAQKHEVPILFFESATRLIKTIEWISQQYSVKKIGLGKELTKQFEHVIVGSMADIKNQVKEIPIKGEWGVVLTIAPQEEAPKIQDTISYLRQVGLSNDQILTIGKEVYQYPKNKLYSLLHTQKNDD